MRDHPTARNLHIFRLNAAALDTLISCGKRFQVTTARCGNDNFVDCRLQTGSIACSAVPHAPLPATIPKLQLTDGGSHGELFDEAVSEPVQNGVQSAAER